MSARLFDVELVPAAVRRGAAFGEAAETLTAHPVSTIAVLDDADRVVGLFGGDDLIAGLFPGYLRELHHTAFAREDVYLLERRAHEAGGDPVERHMREPVSVELATSPLHVAELFLHCGADALPVVDAGRFIGMLPRSEFCRAMLERAGRS